MGNKVFWLKNNKFLVNDQGQLILCDHCPCTASCPSTVRIGTGSCYSETTLYLVSESCTDGAADYVYPEGGSSSSYLYYLELSWDSDGNIIEGSLKGAEGPEGELGPIDIIKPAKITDTLEFDCDSEPSSSSSSYDPCGLPDKITVSEYYWDDGKWVFFTSSEYTKNGTSYYSQERGITVTTSCESGCVVATAAGSQVYYEPPVDGSGELVCFVTKDLNLCNKPEPSSSSSSSSSSTNPCNFPEEINVKMYVNIGSEWDYAGTLDMTLYYDPEMGYSYSSPGGTMMVSCAAGNCIDAGGSGGELVFYSLPSVSEYSEGTMIWVTTDLNLCSKRDTIINSCSDVPGSIKLTVVENDCSGTVLFSGMVSKSDCYDGYGTVEVRYETEVKGSKFWVTIWGETGFKFNDGSCSAAGMEFEGSICDASDKLNIKAIAWT